MTSIPDFAAVRAEFALPTGFPPAVLADAAAAAAARPGRGPDRVDATDVALVTIDPPGSKDLDQAVGVARQGDGFRVTTPSPISARSCRPAGRWTARCAGEGRRSTCPTARCPCTRRCSRRTPRACCPTGRGPPCSGGSTSTARASRWRWRYAGPSSRPGHGSTTPGCRRTSTPAGSTPRSPRCRFSDRCGAPWPCAVGRSSSSCPSRRWSGRPGGPSPCAGAPRSRTGTPRSRCSRACLRPGSCSTPGSACCARCLRPSPTPLRSCAWWRAGWASSGPRRRRPPSSSRACRGTPRPPWPCGGRPAPCCAGPATPRSTARAARRRPTTPGTRGSGRRTRTSPPRCGDSSTGSAASCAWR